MDASITLGSGCASCIAMGAGWTAQHQMRLADKRSGITRADLIAVAETFGIRNPGGIIGRIEAAVARAGTSTRGSVRFRRMRSPASAPRCAGGRVSCEASRELLWAFVD